MNIDRPGLRNVSYIFLCGPLGYYTILGDEEKRTHMAKLMSNIPTVEPFIINCETTTNLDKEWTFYLEEFELFLLASGITNNRQKVALFLLLGGKIYVKYTKLSKNRQIHLMQSSKSLMYTSNLNRASPMNATNSKMPNKKEENLQ